jgi:thiamine-phosphate pyrophosphorylase
VADPVAVAERLPPGAGVVYRGFGAADAPRTGARLAEVARRRGLLLLVGLDAELADKVGAHGVHLPERALDQAPALRAAHPQWLLTGAAHDGGALSRASGLDAVLVSAVFPSASPSAGPPLGVEGLAQLVRSAPCPVYALGGVTADNAHQLLGSGACGIAGVEAFAAAFLNGTSVVR